MTDMISPSASAHTKLPFVRALVEEIWTPGKKSIHYCDGPRGKWELWSAIGAHVLSLEEGRAWRSASRSCEGTVRRCAVLGRLHKINLLHG